MSSEKGRGRLAKSNCRWTFIHFPLKRSQRQDLRKENSPFNLFYGAYNTVCFSGVYYINESNNYLLLGKSRHLWFASGIYSIYHGGQRLMEGFAPVLETEK